MESNLSDAERFTEVGRHEIIEGPTNFDGNFSYGIRENSAASRSLEGNSGIIEFGRCVREGNLRLDANERSVLAMFRPTRMDYSSCFRLSAWIYACNFHSF